MADVVRRLELQRTAAAAERGQRRARRQMNGDSDASDVDFFAGDDIIAGGGDMASILPHMPHIGGRASTFAAGDTASSRSDGSAVTLRAFDLSGNSYVGAGRRDSRSSNSNPNASARRRRSAITRGGGGGGVTGPPQQESAARLVQDFDSSDSADGECIDNDQSCELAGDARNPHRHAKKRRHAAAVYANAPYAGFTTLVHSMEHPRRAGDSPSEDAYDAAATLAELDRGFDSLQRTWFEQIYQGKNISPYRPKRTSPLARPSSLPAAPPGSKPIPVVHERPYVTLDSKRASANTGPTWFISDGRIEHIDEHASKHVLRRIRSVNEIADAQRSSAMLATPPGTPKAGLAQRRSLKKVMSMTDFRREDGVGPSKRVYSPALDLHKNEHNESAAAGGSATASARIKIKKIISGLKSFGIAMGNNMRR